MKFSNLIPKRFIRVVSSTGAILLTYAGYLVATTIVSIPVAIMGAIGLGNVIFYSAASIGLLAGFASFTAISNRLKMWPFEEGQTYPDILPKWLPFKNNQFLNKMAHGIKSVFTEIKNEFKSVWSALKSGIFLAGILVSKFSSKKTSSSEIQNEQEMPNQKNGIVYYQDVPKDRDSDKEVTLPVSKGGLTFWSDAVINPLKLKSTKEHLKPEQLEKNTLKKTKAK